MNNKELINSTKEEIEDKMIAVTGFTATEYMLKKMYILRFLCAGALRLSFLISVWLFLFDNTLWYGMIIFFFAALAYGGVNLRE